jgi:hypothetical protein
VGLLGPGQKNRRRKADAGPVTADAPASTGHSSLSGARYPGDEFAGVNATQDSADLGALAFYIIGAILEVPGTFEVRTYVGIGESADTVLSRHHRMEEQSVILGKRIGSSYAAAGRRGFACSGFVG